jgi:hypothetical protein
MGLKALNLVCGSLVFQVSFYHVLVQASEVMASSAQAWVSVS